MERLYKKVNINTKAKYVRSQLYKYLHIRPLEIRFFVINQVEEKTASLQKQKNKRIRSLSRSE